MIAFIIAGAAVVLGYVAARRFVRNKLRYVDAAQGKAAPIVAGIAAAVIAAPVAWVLPLIGTGTAILFGIGVGAGVASGASDIRRGTAYQVTSGN